MKDKILAAARELFARDGYQAVSMRRLAEAIEYTPAALYVHFKDKESLFHELCFRDFGALSASFQELNSIADPIERVRMLGHAYVRFAVAHPNHYRLMFMTPARAGPPPEKAMSIHGDPTQDGYAFTRAAVQAAIDTGRFRKEFRNVELATQTLWAAVHGLASLQITKADDPWIEWQPFEKRCQTLMGLVIDGMVAPTKGRKAGAS